MSQQLKDRTKAFAIRFIKMVKGIKWNQVDDILIKQIVRSATSVGANYRSAYEQEAQLTLFQRSLLPKQKLTKRVIGLR